MSGKKLYERICKASSLDRAVSGLGSDELAVIAEYLSDLNSTGGIPAQVFGMVTARLQSGEKEVKP